MVVVNQELPKLARKFGLAADHTDALIVHADASLKQLTAQLTTTVAELQSTVATTGRNFNQLSGNLNGLVSENRGRLADLVRDLAKTADNLNKTMEGVASIARDPVLHSSLVGTAQNVQDATAKLKAIATDIQSITGDPKTQADLKGTIANLDAATAKANDILGGFSSASATNASPAPHSSQPPGYPAPVPPQSSRRGFFSQPVAQAQVRETWSNRGGGPASDLNVVLLPGAATHLSFGANDLGYSTTYSFLIDKGSTSTNFQIGAGVLYSKLGLATLFRPFGGPLGIDMRAYDPKHPTLDLYGDLRLAERLQLFYGERSIWGTGARTPSFGIQVNY
jgi:hypothetical protein